MHFSYYFSPAMSSEKTSSNMLKNTLTPFLRKSKVNSRQSRYSQAYKLEELLVSTQIIKFQHRGVHNQYLYNRQLRITNRTGIKIAFKIKSNNPESYEVSPNRESLDDGKSCQIRIRISINTRNLSKYNLDQFLLMWGRHDDNSANITYTESIKLKVRLDVQNVNQELTGSNSKEEKDIILYQQLLKNNREKISQLNKSIQERESQPETLVVTKGMMMTLAIISFFLGYFLM